MTSMNGWKEFSKKYGDHSFMNKYAGQFTVYFKKSNYLYISTALYEALGKPKFLSILVRGSNVGLVSVDNVDQGYTVQVSGETSYCILITAFAKSYKLQVGAYDVHMEAGNVAVFDSQGTPSL